MIRPAGATAVMAQRRSPPKGLDFFPTPPWATRALVAHVIMPLGFDPALASAWDPCCGEGHMAETLRERFRAVEATDVFDYGRGYPVADVLADGVVHDNRADLLITNPPFNIAADIAARALASGRFLGVFLLVRSVWIEGADRYKRLFEFYPPSVFAPFVERVPMVAGRYDPKASSATAYAWIGWLGDRWSDDRPARPITFIPPCRKRLERKEDIRRWCAPADAPLFDAKSDVSDFADQSGHREHPTSEPPKAGAA